MFYGDNNLNSNTTIVTALSAFGFSFLGKKMALGAGVPTLDPTRLNSLTYTSNVAGVNGIYITSAEGSPIAGVTYTMYIGFQLENSNQPVNITFEQVALTTSFSDLATNFAAAINTQSLYPYNGVPVVAANSGGHLQLTETPPTGYGVGEALITYSFITSNVSTVALNAWTVSTAHVSPVGGYAALQRNYIANTGNNQTSTQFPSPAWFGTNAPISTSSYDVITVLYSPIDKPNNDAVNYLNFNIYVDTAVGAPTLAYIAGVIGDFSEQAGLGVGSGVAVASVATTAAGVALIPTGANLVNVTSANAANFVALPANQPIGKAVYITVPATAFHLIMGASESINGGTAGAGSSLVVASTILTCRKVSSTAWIVLANLLSGTQVATATPANS